MANLVKRNNGSGFGMWSILGGAALIAAVYVFAKNFADLRRYIKIEMM